MRPGLNDIRSINRRETNFSVFLRNRGYTIQDILPGYLVDFLSGEFWKFGLEGFRAPQDLKRAEDGYASEVIWKPTYDTYRTRPKAKRIWMSTDREYYADPAVRPGRRATFLVTNELLLGLEIEATTILTNPAVMTNGVTLSGTSQLSDYTNSDPLDVFSDMRLNMRFIPYNAGIPDAKVLAVMSPETFEVLRFHPDIAARFTNADGLITRQQLAEIMGVNEIRIAEGFKADIDEVADVNLGIQTSDLERVWGKDILIIYVDPNIEEDAMTTGAVVWTRMPGTRGIVSSGPLAAGTPIRVRDYPEEGRGGGGDWREADARWDIKIIMPELAYLIKDAVA